MRIAFALIAVACLCGAANTDQDTIASLQRRLMIVSEQRNQALDQLAVAGDELIRLREEVAKLKKEAARNGNSDD